MIRSNGDICVLVFFSNYEEATKDLIINCDLVCLI